MDTVTVIGAGLAGSEAAWQLAEAGVRVRLLEQKPGRRTPAQQEASFAELVCSNSLRSKNPQNAVGQLKEEMRRLGSLIIRCAHEAAVPAGDALAVERSVFGEAVTQSLKGHPNIEVVEQLVSEVPSGPCIVATGPLTEDGLAQALTKLTGAERLYFYDAIAPIVTSDSVDEEHSFRASRYDKGDGDDYVNCPMDEETYNAFVAALVEADPVPERGFEKQKFFEGCLPIEEVAKRGVDTLRFGAMKPVGLTDPRTGRWPYAVLQLRKEDRAGQAFNLVGCQTKLRWGDQKRIFGMIPALKNAEWIRLGVIHRNTYLDSPRLLAENMALKTAPDVRFAGQITGVEGYVESAAHGLLVGLQVASDLGVRAFSPPPINTALGALRRHVLGAQREPDAPHEPQNVNWAMFPPVSVRGKRNKKLARAKQATLALEAWAQTEKRDLAPRSDTVSTLFEEATAQKQH